MDEKKGIAKIEKYFVNFQYGLSIVMALLLLAMIGYEVVMRYVFKSSLMGVEEVMVFPIIWLYMLGGANASYEKSHIECGILTLYIKKEHSMLIFNLVKLNHLRSNTCMDYLLVFLLFLLFTDDLESSRYYICTTVLREPGNDSWFCADADLCNP